MPVLIDGAHALGQLPVNLQQLQPDFFVSNCHKWLCGARGSAIMWVHPDRQPGIKPLIISHGSGCGFISDFIWDGKEGWGLPACVLCTDSSEQTYIQQVTLDYHLSHRRCIWYRKTTATDTTARCVDATMCPLVSSRRDALACSILTPKTPCWSCRLPRLCTYPSCIHCTTMVGSNWCCQGPTIHACTPGTGCGPTE